MRGPREAVNAAVLATAIRVDGLLERHIRRIVAADDRASLFDLHGCRRFGGLAVVLVRPAVILGPMHRLLEAAFRIAERTTALEWLGRWERVLLPGHGGSLRAGCLDGRDARTANATSTIPRALRYAPDPEYWNPPIRGLYALDPDRRCRSRPPDRDCYSLPRMVGLWHLHRPDLRGGRSTGLHSRAYPGRFALGIHDAGRTGRDQGN